MGPSWYKPRRKGVGRFHYQNDLQNAVAKGMARILSDAQQQQELLLQAIVTPGDKTVEGTLIAGVAVPWFEIVKVLRADPYFMHKLDWRKWEEMVAGAYERAGFDEVTLTPRSGDLGRDVIAVKKGFGSIRIVDQVKKYKPGLPVPANDVRALLGVVTADPNTSKGVITTTSRFAPEVETDPLLKPWMPYRLELKDGPALLKWLDELAGNAKG